MEVHIQDFRIIYRILKILQQSMDLTKPNIHTRGLNGINAKGALDKIQDSLRPS